LSKFQARGSFAAGLFLCRAGPLRPGGGGRERAGGISVIINIEGYSNPRKEGGSMSIAKVIEVSCESKKSFEDAIAQGITEAAKSVRNIRGAWVKEQQVVVEGDRVVNYRVDLKITFVIE